QYAEAYKLLYKSISIEGKDSKGGVCADLFATSLQRYENKEISLAEVLMDYGLAKTVIEYNLKLTPDDKFYKSANELIEHNFKDKLSLDCSQVLEVLRADYEQSKTDSYRLLRIKDAVGTVCYSQMFYEEILKTLGDMAPNKNVSMELAEYYEKEGNVIKAITYYRKALALETNNEEKAKIYYRLAYNATQSPQLAVTYCNKAIEHNPQYAKIYLLLSDIYVRGAELCGAGEPDYRIKQKSMYWAAVDRCNLAVSIDPTLKEEADVLIQKYSKNFPTQQELDDAELKVGTPYSINCWISTRTTVRAKE
ncbi:MAG: hypothetical protein SNJ71_03940, partial [Bacteroidales bacterium]